MRREGIFVVLVGFIFIIAPTFLEIFFSTSVRFLLIGIIPGTNIAVPSLVMLSLSLTALVSMIIWPLRDRMIKKINRHQKTRALLTGVTTSRRRFRHTVS